MTSYRSSGGSDEGKLIAYGIMFVFIIIFSIWFYSADASGSGKIADKWVESHTSCDDDGDCSTTHDYLVQFSDSRIYGVFWGRIHWDGMVPGYTISFDARGRRISLWTIRIMVPDIFSYEVLEAPQ